MRSAPTTTHKSRGFVAMRPLALCARARAYATHSMARKRADPHELWVSYADPATLRRRLVGVAQQVRGLLTAEPLPELVLPAEPRMRHGFWFMRFAAEAQRRAAREALHGAPFRTECGSLEGTLQLDAGTRPLDLRAMLNVRTAQPDPVDAWLRRTFGAYGELVSVDLPRVANNWDGGLAFVRFADTDEAEAALVALDGTPSVVIGCNLFVDFAEAKGARPLVNLVHGVADDPVADDAIDDDDDMIDDDMIDDLIAEPPPEPPRQ